nr:MAG TPA: hypothetical protein [Caudoviricetes sp.]
MDNRCHIPTSDSSLRGFLIKFDSCAPIIREVLAADKRPKETSGYKYNETF